MIGGNIKHRGYIILGAILIQLCLGAIYAWSVFTKPLFDAGWTRTETQAVFSAGLVCFAIIMILAGGIMTRIGPRKLTVLGGFVFGLGYILAGLFGSTNFLPIFIFIGIIGGSGIGLVYVVPIAVGMRWFPDKKGLITGLAVAGFGFGAMLWVKLAGSWANFLDPQVFGLSGTFIVYGIIFMIAIIGGSTWMIFPPEGWTPIGWNPPPTIANVVPASGSVNFKIGQMLKTPQYYMILITFTFGASAGLMTIGLMKLFPIQALTAAQITNANAIAGTAMAVFFSLANGFGRIAWGAISDKLGRKNSIIIMMVSQGIIVILFQWMAGTPALLYLGAALIGFNFGGNFALFPTITADTFGTKYIGQNYGWVFLAYGIGGIFGPIMGGKLGDMGNFPLAFTICGILCLIAALVITGVKTPKIVKQ
jgi:OFA family oxalate/formate antiporter-like MFS transporter